MRVDYSREDGDAYIYLIDEIGAGEICWTYRCDHHEVNGMIHLDFDSKGHLVGIEVLDADQLLRSETLTS